jgi:hypothetical protein
MILMKQEPAKPDQRDQDVAIVRSMLLSTFAGLIAVVVLAALASTSDIGTTAAIGISVIGGIVTASISATAVYLRQRR